MSMKKLTKKTAAALIIAIIAISAIAVWLAYPREKTASFSEDFENGLENWGIDAEVPDDPNNPGHSVEWKIEVSTNQSVSPSHSAMFTIDGLQDDGAIWLERKLSMEPNAVRNINVTFQFWSESESFNTLAAIIGYAGNKNPTFEGDLQVIGYANQVEGWKNYTFSSEVTANSNGDAYIALGIAVLWETRMTYYIDDITVDVN